MSVLSWPGAVEAVRGLWEIDPVKTRMRVRRALAVAGVLAALLLVGPRILAFTPYPRLGISIDWTQAGFARVSQVYGPPAQGRLKPGDLLTHINGRPVRPPSLARSLDRVTLPTEAITLSGRRDGEIIEVWVPPAQVSVWQRVRFLLLHVSIAVAAPLVAFVVFWRRPDLGTAGVFLWLACLHAVSVVYDYFEYPVTDPTGPFRALMLAVGWLVLWTPAAALHFFAAFPRPRWAPSARWRSPWFWLVVLGYLAPLAFVVALLRTGQKPEGAFRIFEAFAVGVGAVSLLGRYLFTRGLDWVPSRTERVLALTVVAVFTIAGTLNSVLSEPDWVALMQFEVARLLLSLLSIATLLTPFMLAYLIALDPVFDPRRIVQKGIPYALLSGVLAALYLLIVLGGQRLFAEITGEQTLVLNVVAALVLAFAFAPFRERIQRWLDRLFRRDPIALRAALDGAGRHLLGAVHSEEVRRAVEDGIARGLDQRARVEWPVGAPPRLAAPEELPDHARAAVDNLLAQAGIRLESLALQAQRTAAERRAVELREAATRAELRALHAQVQPHFLFNALNALSYLTETDPPAAQRFTERLADMLRYTVEASTRSASLLSDEIGFVEDYLGIARERYDGDIAFEYRGSRELLSAAVPPLLLQPLVENSLKHGYAVDRPTLHMRLDAQREDGWLTLTFADDGRPSTNGDHRVRIGTGVGLDNLDQRVRRFGGAGASLAALPGDAGGFVVTVRWREAPEGGTR